LAPRPAGSHGLAAAPLVARWARTDVDVVETLGAEVVVDELAADGSVVDVVDVLTGDVGIVVGVVNVGEVVDEGGGGVTAEATVYS
jgi:hypothetical protein